MKILRTADLGALQCWLTGGYCSANGDITEGFPDFYPLNDWKETAPKNLQEVRDMIEHIITEYSDAYEPFSYYGLHYRFKVPKAKNVSILAKRVMSDIDIAVKRYQEDEDS